MRQALAQPSGALASVGCVIPHGTGTQLNDVVESQALREVFGSRCCAVPLYSLKAMVGHTGGAAGALATVAAALVLEQCEVPPNAPLDDQDPGCDVWLPQEHPVPLERERVLVNAYAFGGNNVSLLLEGAA
jgi:3-oxoacyl-[acyl-carrier-protein] synthase II